MLGRGEGKGGKKEWGSEGKRGKRNGSKGKGIKKNGSERTGE